MPDSRPAISRADGSYEGGLSTKGKVGLSALISKFSGRFNFLDLEKKKDLFVIQKLSNKGVVKRGPCTF